MTLNLKWHLLVAFAWAVSCLTHVSIAAPVRLALNWKPEPEFGGFYEAKRSGAANRHGLELELLEGGSGAPVAQLVAAGKAEFGIANADEVVIARARGADLVALFAAMQINPQGIMFHAARGFKTLADLFAAPGLLAANRGAAYFLYLEKKYGPGKVKVVPYNGGVTEFTRDPKFSQQCYVTSEPVAARRLDSDPRTILVADAGYNPYNTVLITSGKVLAEHPDWVAGMAAASAEGWRAYLDDPKPANAVMQKLNPTMDAATFAEAAELQRPLVESADTRAHGLGWMSVERWRLLGRQLVELHVIDAAPDSAGCFRNPR